MKLKRTMAVLITLLMPLMVLPSLAEDYDLSFPPGVFDDILAQVHITPAVVETPQLVDVRVAIKNATRNKCEVTLYSPSAKQIGEPHQLDPDQTVFVTCHYDVNQRTIDNGNVVYFIKYALPNEYGRVIEQSKPIRCKINGNDKRDSAFTPVATPQPSSEWPSLTAKEVMYNYANSYKKEFHLKGVGELRNYYNYAYDQCEKDYFCMRVRPSDSYFDSWYIYFHRDSFQELYNYAVQNGKVTMEMRCSITRYEENQRDMAEALRVRWWE